MTDEPPRFNLFEGVELRDAGIDRVAEANSDWMDTALVLVRQRLTRLGPGQQFMGEDFKAIPGIGQPAHRNAWGALARTLVAQGDITPTGGYARSKTPGNHAHEYKIYVRTVDMGFGRVA